MFIVHEGHKEHWPILGRELFCTALKRLLEALTTNGPLLLSISGLVLHLLFHRFHRSFMFPLFQAIVQPRLLPTRATALVTRLRTLLTTVATITLDLQLLSEVSYGWVQKLLDKNIKDKGKLWRKLKKWLHKSGTFQTSQYNIIIKMSQCDKGWFLRSTETF